MLAKMIQLRFNQILPSTLLLALATLAPAGFADSTESQLRDASTGPRFETFDRSDLTLRKASVRYLESLDLLVFEQRLEGRPGSTLPTPRGQLDGAPVLAYVFPTSLASTDVGFGPTEGVVALAVTIHPDFDDTPLWDEDGDRDYANDGAVVHPHWVVLVEDSRVGGGLAVRQLTEDDDPARLLPPTNPGMPMYMDSPGFSVVLRGDTLRVLVPAYRLGNRRDFRFDAVTAYLQVNTSGEGPMLGVHEVYHVLSGDLSLPGKVGREP